MTQVYAFQNNSDILLKSSSGGAFMTVCHAFAEKYGSSVVFYGAAFDREINVRHTWVYSVEECDIFCGSKYVKSHCILNEQKIIEHISQGKFILYSGTPCQIYALLKYIEANDLPRERFLLIDIICHGTPKPEFYAAYKAWLEKKEKAKLAAYSFRYKPEGWKGYPGRADFSNGKVLLNTAETAAYTEIYMKKYCIAEPCFACPFSKEERMGDITLGDFLGAERLFKGIKTAKGVSLVLAHTDAAKSMMEDIYHQEHIFMKITEDRRYLIYQHNLRKPTSKPENYDQFWDDFEKLDFETLLKKYVSFGIVFNIKHTLKRLVRKTHIIEFYRNMKCHKI